MGTLRFVGGLMQKNTPTKIRSVFKHFSTAYSFFRYYMRVTCNCADVLKVTLELKQFAGVSKNPYLTQLT